METKDDSAAQGIKMPSNNGSLKKIHKHKKTRSRVIAKQYK